MNNWYHELFEAERNIGIGPECIRAVIIFVYGYLLMRFAGRRIFGRWAAMDIVASIIVGSSLSRAITGTAPVLGTMAAMAVIVCLHFIMAQLSTRSRMAGRVLEGVPLELGRDGRLYQEQMILHSISSTDIEEAMRRSKVASLSQMRSIILEPSGRIHVLSAE